MVRRKEEGERDSVEDRKGKRKREERREGRIDIKC